MKIIISLICLILCLSINLISLPSSKKISEYVFIAKWGSKGSQDGQFNFPINISVDKSGNVYVADFYNNRIQKFDSNGKFIMKLGNKNNEQFLHPSGISIDSEGNIYISDFGHHCIQKFETNTIPLKCLLFHLTNVLCNHLILICCFRIGN